MKWFFYTDDDDVIQFQARLEGEGRIGHAYREVGPDDDDFYGISYARLHDAKHGVVEVEDGKGILKPTAEDEA